MIAALTFPGLTALETKIIQLRARDHNYRAVAAATGIAPRKIHDLEHAALKKIVRYLESEAFLQGQR